jgi:hypothetical protein
MPIEYQRLRKCSMLGTPLASLRLRLSRETPSAFEMGHCHTVWSSPWLYVPEMGWEMGWQRDGMSDGTCPRCTLGSGTGGEARPKRGLAHVSRVRGVTARSVRTAGASGSVMPVPVVGCTCVDERTGAGGAVLHLVDAVAAVLEPHL